jgi:carboxypeptidase family protein
MRLPVSQTAVLAGVLISCVGFLRAQEPAQTPPNPQQPPVAAGTESSSKPAQNRSSHGNDFLVRGTVFTPEGLALPGAELHIRRSSEKKFRWHDAANSRGEFAIRVKMGADYEVVAHAKGYQDQSVPVNASTGERFKDVVFHMQRGTGKKS